MSMNPNITQDQVTRRAVHEPIASPAGRNPHVRFEPGRQTVRDGASASNSEETLIIDSRSNLRPAQAVEDKLISLLKSEAVPVSHAHMTALFKGRSHC